MARQVEKERQMARDEAGLGGTPKEQRGSDISGWN